MKTLKSYFLFIYLGLFCCNFGFASIQNEPIGLFNKIWIRDGIQVVLQKGIVPKVEVSSDKDTEKSIGIQNTNGKLIIKQKDSWSNFLLRKLKPSNESLKVIVTFTNINEIFISGASSVESTDMIDSENLLILVSGASKVNLQTKSNWLSLNLSGSSYCKISGSCTKLNIKSTEASRVFARNLLSSDVSINLTEASNAEVYAKNNLALNISGASILKYKTETTTKISKTISGASTVIKL